MITNSLYLVKQKTESIFRSAHFTLFASRIAQRCRSKRAVRCRILVSGLVEVGGGWIPTTRLGALPHAFILAADGKKEATFPFNRRGYKMKNREQALLPICIFPLIALQQKCLADNGFWSGGQRSNSTRYFAGGVAEGAFVALAMSAMTLSQTAFWMSLVGGGAIPRWMAMP